MLLSEYLKCVISFCRVYKDTGIDLVQLEFLEFRSIWGMRPKEKWTLRNGTNSCVKMFGV